MRGSSFYLALFAETNYGVEPAVPAGVVPEGIVVPLEVESVFAGAFGRAGAFVRGAVRLVRPA